MASVRRPEQRDVAKPFKPDIIIHRESYNQPDKQSFPPAGRPQVPGDHLLQTLIAEVLVQYGTSLSVQLKGWKSVSTGESYTVHTLQEDDHSDSDGEDEDTHVHHQGDQCVLRHPIIVPVGDEGQD